MLSPNVGNKLFGAPEALTEEYDCKVDVYSSGLILYLLNCYLPNRNLQRNEILALRERQRNAGDLYHQDDQTIINLMEWVLHEEPNARPTAAEALAYMQHENRD